MQLTIYWDEKNHKWLYSVDGKQPQDVASTGQDMPLGAIKSDFCSAAERIAQACDYDRDDFSQYRKLTVYHGREKLARFRYEDDSEWWSNRSLGLN